MKHNVRYVFANLYSALSELGVRVMPALVFSELSDYQAAAESIRVPFVEGSPVYAGISIVYQRPEGEVVTRFVDEEIGG